MNWFFTYPHNYHFCLWKTFPGKDSVNLQQRGPILTFFFSKHGVNSLYNLSHTCNLLWNLNFSYGVRAYTRVQIKISQGVNKRTPSTRKKEKKWPMRVGLWKLWHNFSPNFNNKKQILHTLSRQSLCKMHSDCKNELGTHQSWNLIEIGVYWRPAVTLQTLVNFRMWKKISLPWKK